MLLGDNKGNQIILPHTTWKTFIARRTDIEQLLQSSAPSPLARSGYRSHKNARHTYCKIEIM